MPFDAKLWDDIRDRIRRQVDVRELGDRLGLKTGRPGEKKILCPSPEHQDTTPSCQLYADHFHCFSCKANGDCFQLYSWTQHCSHADAVRGVAALYGIDVSDLDKASAPKPVRPEDVDRDVRRALGLPNQAKPVEPAEEDLDDAIRHQACSDLLAAIDAVGSPSGKPADHGCAYLMSRGLSKATISKFVVSHLDRQTSGLVARHLADSEAAVACGLVKLHNGVWQLWTRATCCLTFARDGDRLVYPIPRLIDAPIDWPAHPKYLYPPALTKRIFGMAEAAHGTGPLHVVEGGLTAMGGVDLSLRTVAWLSRPSDGSLAAPLIGFAKSHGISEILVVPDDDAARPSSSLEEAEKRRIAGMEGITKAAGLVIAIRRAGLRGAVMPMEVITKRYNVPRSESKDLLDLAARVRSKQSS